MVNTCTSSCAFLGHHSQLYVILEAAALYIPVVIYCRIKQGETVFVSIFLALGEWNIAGRRGEISISAEILTYRFRILHAHLCLFCFPFVWISPYESKALFEFPLCFSISRPCEIKRADFQFQDVWILTEQRPPNVLNEVIWPDRIYNDSRCQPW